MVAEHVAREPIQSRAHKTRAALLQAAAAELNERGYAQTTTKSIATRAGVAAGSFYQYFADKDAVLRELAQQRMHSLLARLLEAGGAPPAPSTDAESLERIARRATRAIVSEIVDYHRRDTGLHAVLTERRHADPELDAMTSEAERTFVAHVEATLGALGYAGDKKAQAFLICSLIEGAVHSHVLGARVVSDKRFLDALTDAIMVLIDSGREAGGRGWKR